jgi:DNA-binding response OmpR family regulator
MRKCAPRPILVVVDLVMPLMGGCEFCERKLRDDTIAAIPVLLLTLETQHVVVPGITSLAKPVHAHELLASVRSSLAREPARRSA